MRNRTLVILALLGALATTAAARDVGPTEPLTLDTGEIITVEAGVLQVPESRVAPTSTRMIAIPWRRLRSTAPKPATPIFLLAGGPGSSGIDALRAAESRREIAFYRGIADVVLFDQRGAGHATPALTCPMRARYPAEWPLERAALRRLWREMLTQCRDHWLAEGIDLSAYNTVESAADVNALRAALGYRRITLIGGSYGSHLGLQVMRLYPDTVARAVFHGIEGPDQTWDDPDAVLAVLRRIDKVAQAQAPAHGLRVPDGGYLAELARVIERLSTRPETVTVSRDGESVPVIVDAEIVRQMSRRGGAGNHDRLDAWPRMVLSLADGDLRQAANAALAMRELRLPDPMHWSMDCSSAISPARRARIAPSTAPAVLGRLNAEYEDLCDLWPSRVVDQDYWSLPQASIPTLLFHGTWDVSTPLLNAREVAAGLRAAHLVIVEGGNHGVLYNLYGRWPPMHALMRDFLTGKPVAPPPRVVMPWTSPDAGGQAHD